MSAPDKIPLSWWAATLAVTSLIAYATLFDDGLGPCEKARRGGANCGDALSSGGGYCSGCGPGN